MKQNPEKENGIWTFITYTWMNELFSKGNKQQIELEDLCEIGNSDRSSQLCNRIEREWKKEKVRSLRETSYKPNLLGATVKTFGSKMALFGLLMFFRQFLLLFKPLVIGWLIQYIQLNSSDAKYAYVFAFILSFVSIFETLILHFCNFQLQRIGWQIRTSMCGLIYRKILRLNSSSISQISTGHVVNLCAADVLRFDMLPWTLPMLLITPSQCAAVIVILWMMMGEAALGGMGCMVAAIILMILLGRGFAKLRMKAAKLTDGRIKMMSQVLAGMKVIKMHNWQRPFAKLIQKLRRYELKEILKSSFLRSFTFTLSLCCAKLVTFITLIMFVVNGGQLNSAKVFIAIGLFNQLQFSVGFLFQKAIERTSESIISLKRIEKFLVTDDNNTNPTCDGTTTPNNSEKGTVSVENVTANWNDEQRTKNVISNKENHLRDLSMDFHAGLLYAIIGKVGSGKTSFLMAILDELPLMHGNIQVSGKISYVPQTPWLISGTFKENILFGENYDEELYKRVIKACALDTDIQQLPNGDNTLVGERGVILSGGQKARIGFARAVYRKDCDIFLLDNPLCAVDARVAKHLFEECIMKFLKNKTRILVTHHLQYLDRTDQIIVLDKGQAKFQGKYEALRIGEDLVALKQNYGSKIHGADESCKKDDNGSFFVQHEKCNSGIIKWSVYLEYFRFASHCTFFVIMTSIAILSHSTFVVADWWISRWVANDENCSFGNSTHLQYVNTTNNCDTIGFTDQYYINWYIVIFSTYFLSLLVRCAMHFHICVISGIELHNKMFYAILHAPMRFFDTNPVGRILNRFSKDMNQIDELLPIALLDFLQISGTTLSIIVLTCVINYFVIIIVLPLLAILIYYRKYYLNTSREIKRLEGATRSPVYSLIASTLHGLTTIRAFQLENQFQEKFHDYQDSHNTAWFMFIAGSRWLGLRLDLLTCTFITIASFTTVAASTFANIDTNNAGLILVNSVMLLGLLQWGVRQSTEVENLMTSVERVQDYHRIKPENTGTINAPPGWPYKGNIEFKEISYAHFDGGPFILQNISLKIQQKEKIGIVGRTGAGKSSLVSALFRFNRTGHGDIIIDGISISSLNLENLRRALSIIPQDPILFSGTLRYNLDPFDQHSDDELWFALEQVEMKPLISNCDAKLDTKVCEFGSNFSVGQRQLICLARAILKKSKIVIIDEATANIDYKTDAIIQSTIRNTFKECTVLTIAHRLQTIIDSDRILVLDAGKVVEFDTPSALLTKDKRKKIAKYLKNAASEKGCPS